LSLFAIGATAFFAWLVGFFVTGMVMVGDRWRTGGWCALWYVNVPLLLLSMLWGSFGEEARLRRRLRGVERDTRLLELRRDVERAEARYSETLDRLLSDEPAVPQWRVRA
jgi:hypothetical protein